MTGAPEDLLQAAYGLRKAAEAQFTGNDYYQVASEIGDLIEHLGGGDGTVPAGKNAAYGFATMLDEVRKLAKSGTSGSQYSVIATDLDRLASFLALETKAGAKPASGGAHKKIESFDDLAAASKARVDHMAASLGIAAAHRAPAAPASDLPERRSSEPCSMAELAPLAEHPAPQAEAAQAPSERRLESRSSEAVRQTLESVEPADLAAETAPKPIGAETTPHLGSPAPQGEVFVIEETVIAEVAIAEPAVLDQKIEADKPVAAKHKEPKTLFRLWLDLAFGRKD